MTTPYTPQFHAGIAPGSRRSALRVLPIVFEITPHASVIDVGCGTGAWLNAALQLGATEVVGVDGDYVDRTQLEIPDACFVPSDLASTTIQRLRQHPAIGPRTFDLCMSMEVAEHLPPQAASGFVDLLCSLAPVVVFSAAIPFQGGTDHLNEQFPSYWVPHFARNAFLPFDVVRPRIWEDTNVEWWYRQNTLVFARATAVSSGLKPGGTDRGTLDVVHPEQYQRVVAWGSDLWRQVHGRP